MPRRTDISSGVVMGAAACVATVGGCAPKQSWGYPANIDPVAAAQSVAAGCELGGQVDFEVVDGVYLVMSRLDPDAEYERLDCLLRGLRSLGLPLGFIGNEAAH